MGCRSQRLLHSAQCVCGRDKRRFQDFRGPKQHQRTSLRLTRNFRGVNFEVRGHLHSPHSLSLHGVMSSLPLYSTVVPPEQRFTSPPPSRCCELRNLGLEMPSYRRSFVQFLDLVARHLKGVEASPFPAVAGYQHGCC